MLEELCMICNRVLMGFWEKEGVKFQKVPLLLIMVMRFWENSNSCLEGTPGVVAIMTFVKVLVGDFLRSCFVKSALNNIRVSILLHA